MKHHILAALAFLLSALAGSAANAQWTITYDIDQTATATAIGPERLANFNGAVDRVKKRLERILANSTGNVLIKLSVETPNPATALAATTNDYKSETLSAARTKLINIGGAESQDEQNLYTALPTSNLPYVWTGTTQVTTNTVFIPASLNKHLQFQQVTGDPDAVMKFHPQDANIKWQYAPSKIVLANYFSFEQVLLHETLHALGFESAGDSDTDAGGVMAWDLFRFKESDTITNFGSTTTLVRQLSPANDATWQCVPINATHRFKAARGKRAGGDNAQAGHWREKGRLTPMNPIGIMDPYSYQSPVETGAKFYTKADIEALDIMGWDVDPSNAVFSSAPIEIESLTPADTTTVTVRTPTFTWTEDSTFLTYAVLIYEGSPITTADPVRAYYDLTGGSFTLPFSEQLEDGHSYSWYIVGDWEPGYDFSETRSFTVDWCKADFSRDGIVGIDDLFLYLNAYYSGDPAADMNDSGGVPTIDGISEQPSATAGPEGAYVRWA